LLYFSGKVNFELKRRNDVGPPVVRSAVLDFVSWAESIIRLSLQAGLFSFDEQKFVQGNEVNKSIGMPLLKFSLTSLLN
jgi:hypothetical protein